MQLHRVTLETIELEPVPSKSFEGLTIREKIEAVIAEGICLNKEDAYYFLVDCGEIEEAEEV